jgi:hypothetical protein
MPVLLATLQPALPEIASITSARQLQPRSRLENSSEVRLLRQMTAVDDSLACTELLLQGRLLLYHMEECQVMAAS